MLPLKLAPLILILFLFASCRVDPPQIANYQEKSLYITGPYHHKISGMIFPEKVGDFRRVSITQFTQEGNDTGVSYNANNFMNSILASVFVYPAPRIASFGSPSYVIENSRKIVLRDHLKELKNTITDEHPDAKLISEKDYTLTTGGKSYKGTKVVYELKFQYGFYSIDSISHLYLFQKGKWLIKYRITFPKTTAPQFRTHRCRFSE